MTGDDNTISALNEALKQERTLADCFGGYRDYFTRWRIHRLESWMRWNAEASSKRVEALQIRINELDTIPSTDRYDFDLEAVTPADVGADRIPAFEYFRQSLTDAAAAYEAARKAANDADDSVSAHLAGSHKREIEDTLQRVEAKICKVELVGAALYLAEHMHQLK